MVSTRHHPRPFPPPELAASPTSTRRSPQTPTSTTSSSKAGAESPAPTTTAKRSRATSRKRSSIANEERDKSPTKSTDAEDTITASTARTRQRSQSRPSKAVTRSKAVAQEKQTFTHTPPPLLIPWMTISLPLVIWDTFYVLGRPYTMPGGRFHAPLWKPYALYGTVDYMYGWPALEARNGFTSAQATLNVVETAIYMVYLALLARSYAGGDGFFRGVAVRSITDLFTRYDEHGAAKVVFRGGSDLALAVLLCFTCAVMTVSKTVLYGLNEVYSGFANVGHNSVSRLIWLWIIPNGAWIVVPAYLAWILGREVVDGLTGKKTLDGHKIE